MAETQTFPEPTPFTALGEPASERAAMKLLEETSELCEAVKALVSFRGSGKVHDVDSDVLEDVLRTAAIDELADCWQALANYLGPRWLGGGPYTFDMQGGELCREDGLEALAHAACIYADTCGDNDPADIELYCLDLAGIVASEFTDDEVAAAYGRCLQRNRDRGRL